MWPRRDLNSSFFVTAEPIDPGRHGHPLLLDRHRRHDLRRRRRPSPRRTASTTPRAARRFSNTVQRTARTRARFPYRGPRSWPVPAATTRQRLQAIICIHVALVPRIRRVGAGRLVRVHVGASPAADGPDLRQRVRREQHVQLQRGLHQPVRIDRRRAGGAAGRGVLPVRDRAGRAVPAVRQRGAQSAGLPVRRVHDRVGDGAVPRVRVVCDSRHDLPAVRGHLRRRHRAVPDFGSGGKGTYVEPSWQRRS